ncbi:MAG: M55 family metallopeptidase [Candidatus Brockarchaeota archaeon]|nr:M55 family metallopeptidase [Candidatus Brockarchaeota archaeon]
MFISVDMEGVSGLVQWDASDRLMERELVTAEANAAVAGAFDGGATEVLVTEAHGNMRNILPEKMDDRATFLSGQPKPKNHMSGIDPTFKAVLLVGYHSKAGTLNGVMAHTFTGSVFSLKFNGLELGEIGTDAAIAGHYGVPVAMVTGDRAACLEARELLGDVEAIAVKEGVSRSSAICIPPQSARKLVREGAKRAVKAAAGGSPPKPFKIIPPVRAEITFTDPSYADGVSNIPSVERIDGRRIAFAAPDMIEAFELFNAIQFLAGVVR